MTCDRIIVNGMSGGMVEEVVVTYFKISLVRDCGETSTFLQQKPVSG